MFAIARLLGVPGTLGTLAFTYIFGPAIAFWISRYGRTRKTRKRILGLVLAGILGAAYTVAAFLDSPASALAAVLTTAVVWAPQIAFIYFLHAAWKSGLRSAGIDPDAKLNSEQGD